MSSSLCDHRSTFISWNVIDLLQAMALNLKPLRGFLLACQNLPITQIFRHCKSTINSNIRVNFTSSAGCVLSRL